MEYGIWCLNVSNQRFEKIKELVEYKCLDKKDIKLLNGDASFRKYYRSGNYIFVDSPPDSQKNKEFVQINELLKKNLINTPSIAYADIENGYFILEDLGDITLDKYVNKDNIDQCYTKVCKYLLFRIFNIETKDLMVFDQEFMKFEMSLCKTWFIDKNQNNHSHIIDDMLLDESIEYISQEILKQKTIAMHRDFHCRNIMQKDGKFYLIDYQDMVKGPYTYDLASLLFDCYINLDPQLVDKLCKLCFEFYQDKKLALHGYNDFIYDLKMISLQRHIKILGIFSRLSIRDKKDGYLKYIPKVLDYVLDEAKFLQIDGLYNYFLKIKNRL